MNKEYIEGYNAAVADLEMSSCPYEKNSEQYKDWMTGYKNYGRTTSD